MHANLTTRKVQRLDIKPKSKQQAVISQVFGGGMMAMTQEQWDVIQQVFDLHYMGAAEYEFGAFPKAIAKLVEKRKDYTGWEFVLLAREITPGYWRENSIQRLRRAEINDAKGKNQKPPRLNRKKLEERAKVTNVTDRTIYVYGNHNLKAETETLIKAVAKDALDVKRGAGMSEALDPEPPYPNKTVGWFDLDNQIFWFIDKNMWEDTIKLFG